MAAITIQLLAQPKIQLQIQIWVMKKQPEKEKEWYGWE